MVTALPLHSQPWVSPGNIPMSLAQPRPRMGSTQGRAKPFLQWKWGMGHPFQGLCLCRWEAKLETGAETRKSTSTCFGSLCQAFTRSLHSRTTEAAGIVGDRQYGGILSMGTLTGIEVAVIPMVCCALAKVGRVSKRAKVIETERPRIWRPHVEG